MLGHRDADRVLSRASPAGSIATVALLVALSGLAFGSEGVTDDKATDRSARQRLAERSRMASSGVAPRFPRWRRGGHLSTDGIRMGEHRPFAAWVVATPRPRVLFPATIADPERWEAVQEQLLPVGGCPCTGGSGAPGEVPPPTLRIGKTGVAGQVVLVWSASCSPDAADYAVHEGQLRVWYSHGARTCSTSGGTTWTLTPAPGSRYFLVTPLTLDDEGSYGRRSDGVERSQGFPACRPTLLADACP